MLSWNTALFLSANAASKPGAMWQHLAEAVANAPVLMAPVLLSCLWIWGPPARRAALIATAAGVLAGQGINLLLGLAWFEPRPFMAGIGHTWLDHVADNGFPSDHATLAWGLRSRARPAAGARSPAWSAWRQGGRGSTSAFTSRWTCWRPYRSGCSPPALRPPCCRRSGAGSRR